jgi:hypothetical protein
MEQRQCSRSNGLCCDSSSNAAAGMLLKQRLTFACVVLNYTASPWLPDGQQKHVAQRSACSQQLCCCSGGDNSCMLWLSMLAGLAGMQR